ncbi:MAG TPA: hypothetical protein VJS42_00610 [Steroidobacteraceae bacterium]|nr:hypothetical protein [Steroidobacteraceae bacterium]
MKLRVLDLNSGKTVELDCKLEAMGGTAGGVTFLARADAEVVVTSFTHTELCRIIMHYRDRCDIDEVMQALDDDEAESERETRSSSSS